MNIAIPRWAMRHAAIIYEMLRACIMPGRFVLASIGAAWLLNTLLGRFLIYFALVNFLVIPCLIVATTSAPLE